MEERGAGLYIAMGIHEQHLAYYISDLIILSICVTFIFALKHSRW